MDYQNVMERLWNIDRVASLTFPHETFDCVLVGGAALLTLKLIKRGTLDGDILDSDPKLDAIFEAYDFNTAVKSMISCFPYRYLDRIVRIEMPSVCIRFFTPSIEDLIVSKLYAYRKKDIQDIQDIIQSGRYDSNKLAMIVQEAKLSSLNERMYQEMVDLYLRHFGGKDHEDQTI